MARPPLLCEEGNILPHFSALPIHSHLVAATGPSLAELKRQILARIGPAADGDQDVLLAVDHIGHRGSALRSGHPDGANLLAGLLVIGSQHRATGSSRGCR